MVPNGARGVFGVGVGVSGMPVCGMTACGMAVCAPATQGEVGESGNMVRGWGRGGWATGFFFDRFFSLCFFFSAALPFTVLSSSDLVLSQFNLMLSADEFSKDGNSFTELVDMTAFDVCTCESSLTSGTDVTPCTLVQG